MAKAELSHATITEEELTALGVKAFEALGLSTEHARQTCRVMVLADLFGISTHGFSRIESYGERLLSKGINPVADVKVTRAASGVVLVDGDNGVGPLVGMTALEATMQAARDSGIAVGFVRSSNHFGPVSPYTYLAAEAGFASIIGSNASVTMAPWGGSDARLGNSPVGFGVPGPDGQHFMLDMAISVAARAKIRNAVKAGKPIPDSWATDALGRPTTDPSQALDGFLQPIGGHKGYGLALFVDLFAGLLSNAAYLTHVKSWLDNPDEPQNVGHFYILIDTRVLGSSQWLADRMRDFAGILHGSPAVDPQAPVIVPGEIELARMHKQKAQGITLDRSTLELLNGFVSPKT